MKIVNKNILKVHKCKSKNLLLELTYESVLQNSQSYIEKKNSNIIPKYGYYPYSVYEPMQFWGIQNI